MSDRQITISVGNSRNSKSWRAETLLVSAFYERLSKPAESPETYSEYISFDKSRQDELKDVGGFMGGTLNGTRRKAANVTGRDVVTLDLDNIQPYGAENVDAKVKSLGINYCIYSTRKHTPAKPRLRIILPLDRTVAPNEYEPIARRLAQQIGIDMADRTTFDVSRLMYWPSKCADAEFYFRYDIEKPFVSADTILGTYADWHNRAEWVQAPGEKDNIDRQMKRQGDPLEKAGIVGAFCRTYTIEQAMAEFIPGVYEAVDNTSNRYTYLGGSTTGGAIVYDDKFLYSHHATDPCGEKLVNAFDMVRLHKFGDLDEDKDPNTPVTKLPSYLNMCEIVSKDGNCRATLDKDRLLAAAADFSGVANSCTLADNPNWAEALDVTVQGKVKNTIDNFRIILENDPGLKGRFAYNAFSERKEVLGVVPWNASDERRMWTDADTDGLYWYIEHRHEVSGRGNIDSALRMYMSQHSFNDVQNFINGLSWDGTKRLDTLFIDYLGAENTLYTRTVTRKMFIAAVARAMTPGVKFDNMLILVGSQGLGKSTILRKMSKGWFNDSICSFEGKDAAELLRGIWIVEISELGAFNKSDTRRIKQFLSLNSDIFRAAYARDSEERKRKCVFFGSTNDNEFLRDPTGERRFWPVDCEESRIKKSLFIDLDENAVNQIWAEARAYWVAGEPLYLDKEIELMAIEKQQEHKEHDVKAGMIEEFVNRKVPADWQRYTIDQRRMWWGSVATQLTEDKLGGDSSVMLVERDRISAVEVWVELFGNNKSYIQSKDTRTINSILDNLEGWERSNGPMRINDDYGKQRCYIRK